MWGMQNFKITPGALGGTHSLIRGQGGDGQQPGLIGAHLIDSTALGEWGWLCLPVGCSFLVMRGFWTYPRVACILVRLSCWGAFCVLARHPFAPVCQVAVEGHREPGQESAPLRAM